MPHWFGLLNVDKPPGQSSRWVVDQVQRLVKPTKVGHAGTLDPLATGVLVLCLGQATRLIGYVQQMRKRYRGTFILGRTSTTEDVDGEVTELASPPQPTRLEIEAAASRFVGEIMQRPPAVSAVKVGGERAYNMARAGKEFELAPRPVTVHWLEVTEYEYPRLTLEVECGSGTYIRSLGRDLAESLGTGAVMSALTRSAIGRFRIEEAIDVSILSRENLPNYLLPPLCAVDHLRKLSLSAAESARIAQGQFIPCPESLGEIATGEEFAALDDRGNLTATVHLRSDGQLGPVHNFGTA